jgi:hypothetical protein
MNSELEQLNDILKSLNRNQQEQARLKRDGKHPSNDLKRVIN